MTKFKYEADSKFESTRGLVLATASLDENVADHLFRVVRGKPNNIVPMDDQDLLQTMKAW